MVWLTATPGDVIPIELLQLLYPLSWDAIGRLREPVIDGEDSFSGKGSAFMALLATSK